VEKPLCTLWKNYQSTSKPDVQMKVTVTQSGLKAVTKEHGLTEYWSHRITYCAAPTAFPKVFCWVYRHEGRKLKQELRCHAVLCSKESVARTMAQELRSRLVQALTEFKRDKLSKQKARLSLVNSVYDNPSLPRRKILLLTGSNYRPPLERSKSAPKLMSIEESLEEEEEAEARKSFRTKERFRVLSKIEERSPREEKDPFGGDVWGKDGVHVAGEFDTEDEGSKEGVELDPEPRREGVVRNSWPGEDLFPSHLEEEYGDSLTGSRSEHDLPTYRSLREDPYTEDRKKLVEGLLEVERGFTKLYREIDEESTPSLQSISSGSEGRPLNLDSLSEEESDESGFAEPSEPSSNCSADDKVRDLPHHQLVKSCILSTKSPCVHV
jgi:hypothetical protein